MEGKGRKGGPSFGRGHKGGLRKERLFKKEALVGRKVIPWRLGQGRDFHGGKGGIGTFRKEGFGRNWVL